MVAGIATASALFPAGNDPCAESGGKDIRGASAVDIFLREYPYMDFAFDLHGESAEIKKESGIGRNEN